MNNDKTDPLSSLISTDVRLTDRTKLAGLLKPFLIIDESTKEFAFLPAFYELNSNGDKVEIILLASKARALLFNEADGMTQGDIINLALIAEGSVKSTLKRLIDNYKIRKNKEGLYSVPGHRISELVKRFNS